MAKVDSTIFVFSFSKSIPWLKIAILAIFYCTISRYYPKYQLHLQYITLKTLIYLTDKISIKIHLYQFLYWPEIAKHKLSERSSGFSSKVTLLSTSQLPKYYLLFDIQIGLKVDSVKVTLWIENQKHSSTQIPEKHWLKKLIEVH